MPSKKDTDNICAICAWNVLVSSHTHCAHPKQKNEVLKQITHYNSSCKLFSERDTDFYEEENQPKQI